MKNQDILIKTSVLPISIDKELEDSFLDYAMSVIISRALPDVRDGLKPVHRRILYAMHTLNLYKERPYRKSATVVGEVIGKYHPHGDMAIYQSLVGMVQDFTKRYPLMDGQGNWGSVDGDNAAAHRYTEVRMAEIARDVLSDIEKETVDFVPTYDESHTEPIVLPSKLPQLLINGSNGIAVGMATSIPPHNLREVIKGCIAILETPEISDRELFALIPAPDFPGGGTICGVSGVLKAYKTGHGSLKLRGTVEIEEEKGREQLIITEIPYQVNKAELIEKIAEHAKNKIIEGIANIRDESSRAGIRVVIEIKRGHESRVIQNQLFKHTSLESSVSIILLAILNNKPVVFTLRGMIVEFLEHRREIIRRKAEFELKKAKTREHILQGLIIAINNIDETISIIKNSDDSEVANINLQTRFKLSMFQSKAVLDMRLSKITCLEIGNLKEEIEEIKQLVATLDALLSSPDLVKEEIIKELTLINEKYGDERRTKIDLSEETLNDIDLIPNDEVVITLTQKGYIKRADMDNYAVQHRGGRGKKGLADLSEHDDFMQDIFVGKNHDTLLFFTNKGRIYSTRTFEIPEGGRTARGRAIVNILPLGEGEKVIKLLGTSDLQNQFLVLVTKKGVVKKTDSKSFGKIRSTGIIAIDLREGDELAFCALSSGSDDIVIATNTGYGIKFNEKEIRSMGRQAAGVRGINIKKRTGEVIGLEVMKENEDAQLLFATSRGYGKQVKITDFRVAHRGGMGVRTIPVDARNGNQIGMVKISEKSNILLVDHAGKIIVLNPDEIRTMHRSAKGVRLIRLDDDRRLLSVVAFDNEETPESDMKLSDQIIETEASDSVVDQNNITTPPSLNEELFEDDLEDEVYLEDEEELIEGDEEIDDNSDLE